MKRAWATAALVAIGSCHRAEPPPLLPSSEVEFAGCFEVARDGGCALRSDSRTLTFWWPRAAGNLVEVVSDRARLSVSEAAAVGGGTRIRVTPPPAARWIELRLSASGRRHLELRPAVRDELVQRAIDLRAAGHESEIVPLLAAEQGRSPRDRRAAVLEALGVSQLAAGQPVPAIDSLLTARRLAQETGPLSLALRTSAEAAFVLLDARQDYGRAREILDTALIQAGVVPQMLPTLLMTKGLLTKQTGDLRGALRAYHEASTQAQRLGLEADGRAANRQMIAVLRRLSREEEALALERELVHAPADLPCDPSDDLVDLALTLAAVERKGGPAQRAALWEEDPADLLARAALPECLDPARRRNILIERLLLAIDRHQIDSAKARHRELLALPDNPSPLLALWQADAEGRLALAERSAGTAVRHFEAELARAAQIGASEELFRAQVGLGQAREAAGQKRAAMDIYRKAESTLEQLLAQIPLGEGVNAVSLSHVASTECLVSALLSFGLMREAMDAIRAANARSLDLATRADRVGRLDPARMKVWDEALGDYRRIRSELESEALDWGASNAELERRLTASGQRRVDMKEALDRALRVLSQTRGGGGRSLRPPAPGELMLAYFQVRDGWIAFSASARGVRAARLGAGHPQDDPGSLLAPFDAELSRAERVTFLMPTALWNVDLQAAPWRGRPLAAARAVAFGLDVDSCSDARGCAPPLGHAALVVADPSLDLQGARREADGVEHALQAAGFIAHSLRGLEANQLRVLPLLAAVDFFHYAGHGERAGAEGLDSVLPLAGGTRLYVADILSLDRAPPRVVLSACEGARTPEGSGGLSLAHAFVAAGARAVIAATRRVADDTARALVVALYQQHVFDPDTDPAAALRGAQMALARADAGSDWASFRLVVP